MEAPLGPEAGHDSRLGERAFGSDRANFALFDLHGSTPREPGAPPAVRHPRDQELPGFARRTDPPCPGRPPSRPQARRPDNGRTDLPWLPILAGHDQPRKGHEPRGVAKRAPVSAAWRLDLHRAPARSNRFRCDRADWLGTVRAHEPAGRSREEGPTGRGARATRPAPQDRRSGPPSLTGAGRRARRPATRSPVRGSVRRSARRRPGRRTRRRRGRGPSAA